jgi:anthranilate phosphoribosyltransferase
MNAGAALYIAKKADTLADGIRLAASLIDSGAALAVLDAFCKESQAFLEDHNA